MPRELLEFYTGVRGFEVVRLNGYESFQKRIIDTGLYETIKKLAAILNLNGWTPQNAGNISIRETPHHSNFTITASGSNFSDLRIDDIVHVAHIGITVGDQELIMGSNRGRRGEFNSYRLLKSLKDQNLLEQLKTDLDLDIKFNDPEERLAKLKQGRELITQLGISYAQIAEMREHRDKFYNLAGFTKKQSAAFNLAYHCENIPYNIFFGMELENANREVDRQGLSLKRLVSYLGEKNLIKCKVYTLAPEDRKPSSEALLHGIIYANRWMGPQNVNAIVHCHAPEIVDNPGNVPVTETPVEEAGYGTLELAVETIEAISQRKEGPYTVWYDDESTIGNKRHDIAVVLQGHGPVVVTNKWESFDKTLGHALARLKEIDRRSKMGYLAKKIEAVKEFTYKTLGI
ncbi:MAG: class II aldolase/adducin family protein [Nanoarchaeota archaeon]|nr:class II aldolase/adducin family protein [Nanoarchaeota archaeon]